MQPFGTSLQGCSPARLVRALLIIKLYPIPYPVPQSWHIVREIPIYLLHQTQVLLAITFFLVIKIASSEVHHAAISMAAHACGAVLL